MISLVVTDLDGTVWGPDERIHPRTVAAIKELQAAGIPVLAATGRRLTGAAAPLERHGLELPMVVLDGALGRHVDRKTTFHQAAYDPVDAKRVLGTFRASGLSPVVHVDRPDIEVVADVDCSTSPLHLQRITPQRAIEVPEDVVASEPVLLYNIVDGHVPALKTVADQVGDAGSPVLNRDVVYGRSRDSRTLTVRPPGVSKWEGVLAWCREQVIDPSRVLAVGDGQNDLELLAGARISCAIADGSEEAKGAADHLLSPPGEGGWDEILNLI